MTKPKLQDYAEDVPETSPEQLALVVNLSRQLYRKQQELSRIMVDAERVREDIAKLTDIDLPAAMVAANVSEQAVGNGYTVELYTQVASASMQAEPKTQEDAAVHEKRIAWLEAHGQEGLVKREVRAFFDRKEVQFFRKFVADLRKRKKPVNAQLRNYVHAQTWGAFVREAVKDPDFPRELFGVFEKKVARIVAPKEK